MNRHLAAIGLGIVFGTATASAQTAGFVTGLAPAPVIRTAQTVVVPQAPPLVPATAPFGVPPGVLIPLNPFQPLPGTSYVPPVFQFQGVFVGPGHTGPRPQPQLPVVIQRVPVPVYGGYGGYGRPHGGLPYVPQYSPVYVVPERPSPALRGAGHFPAGTPRNTVLREMGSPSSAILTNQGETLIFSNGMTVYIHNGQVAQPK